MSADRRTLAFDAPLADHDAAADALLEAFARGDERAIDEVKWNLARFRGRPFSETRGATIDRDDARQVVAHRHAFETWGDLAAFAADVATHGDTWRFERAVEAVVDGDLATLRAAIDADPALVHARSARRHHAMLLHYLAANGVENARQRTPANAVDVMRLLLGAGADANAHCDAYGTRCSTMGLLVSSAHPHGAGLQLALAELLVARGARLVDDEGRWPGAVVTALTFGYLDTAEGLERHALPHDDLAAAAGLGRLVDVERLLPDAPPDRRHAALALAAQLGHADVVARLLDAGEDPDRLNPEGFHSHATPLHHAALGGHLAVVELLLARGARTDVRDALWEATPLEWARHAGQEAVVARLAGVSGSDPGSDPGSDTESDTGPRPG